MKLTPLHLIVGVNLRTSFLSRTFLFAFLICLLNQALMAQQSPIVGKWAVDATETIAAFGTQQAAQYDSLDQSGKDGIINYLDKQYFEFKSDGRFVIGEDGGGSYEGNWSLTNMALDLTYDEGSQLTWNFTDIQATKLNLTLINDPSSAALVHQVVLIPYTN